MEYTLKELIDRLTAIKDKEEARKEYDKLSEFERIFVDWAIETNYFKKD